MIRCAWWDSEDPTLCRNWQVITGCMTLVSGRLPPEVILRVLRRNHGRFRACYQRALQDDPRLYGRVVLRFAIAPAGYVTRVSTSSDMPNRRVPSCIARAAADITYPRSHSGSIGVSYPMVLTPVR